MIFITVRIQSGVEERECRRNKTFNRSDIDLNTGNSRLIQEVCSGSFRKKGTVSSVYGGA